MDLDKRTVEINDNILWICSSKQQAGAQAKDGMRSSRCSPTQRHNAGPNEAKYLA